MAIAIAVAIAVTSAVASAVTSAIDCQLRASLSEGLEGDYLSGGGCARTPFRADVRGYVRGHIINMVGTRDRARSVTGRCCSVCASKAGRCPDCRSWGENFLLLLRRCALGVVGVIGVVVVIVMTPWMKLILRKHSSS